MKSLKQLVLIFFFVSVVALLVTSAGEAQKKKPATNPAAAEAASKAAAAGGDTTAALTAPTNRDFSMKFDHFDSITNREDHKELSDQQRCEVCHERTNDEPTIKLPYHDACVKCHAEEFASAKLQICADCHNKPYNAQPSVFNFPQQLNQFGMEFSHNTHSKREGWDCNKCHYTPNDNQTARSSFPGHKECFTCHKAVNQPAKGYCNECHNDKAQAQKFRSRGQVDFAYTYFRFNHGKHLAVGRECAECHDVNNSDATSNTDISRITLVLSRDMNKIHKSNCFQCHDKTGNERTNSPQCNKCHVRPVGDLVNNPPKEYGFFTRKG